MDLVDKFESGVQRICDYIWHASQALQISKRSSRALAPEWEVEFISDDISEDEIPKGDATICSRAMEIYLDKDRYHNLVVIPELELMQYDYSAIKERLAEFL